MQSYQQQNNQLAESLNKALNRNESSNMQLYTLGETIHKC